MIIGSAAEKDNFIFNCKVLSDGLESWSAAAGQVDIFGFYKPILSDRLIGPSCATIISTLVHVMCTKKTSHAVVGTWEVGLVQD